MWRVKRYEYLLSGIATLVAWEWPALGIKGESSAAHSRSLRRLGRHSCSAVSISGGRRCCQRALSSVSRARVARWQRGTASWASRAAAAAFGRRRWLQTQPWLVRRLQGASGGAGLHGAAAIVEVHPRTLECVGAATYDALCGSRHQFTESLSPARFFEIRPVSRLLRRHRSQRTMARRREEGCVRSRPRTQSCWHRWFFWDTAHALPNSHKGLRLRSAVQSSCRRNTLPVTTFSRLRSC